MHVVLIEIARCTEFQHPTEVIYNAGGLYNKIPKISPPSVILQLHCYQCYIEHLLLSLLNAILFHFDKFQNIVW